MNQETENKRENQLEQEIVNTPQEATEAIAEEEIIEKSTKTYLLKVISGPHKGAEIPLKLGSYSIGSGDEADIIFHDDAIEAKHVILILKIKTQTLKDAAGKLKIDGVAIADFPHGIQLFEILEMGSTAFAIGEEGREWPALKLPTAQPIEESKIEPQLEKPPKGGDAVSPDAAASMAMPIDRAQAERKIERWINETIGKYKVLKPLKFLLNSPLKVQLAVLLGSFFTVFLIVMMFLSFIFDAGESLSDAGHVQRQMILAEKIIEKPPFEGHIYFELQEGRDFIIKGYLKDAAEEQRLRYLFKEDHIHGQFQIYRQDRLQEAVENLIHIHKLDIRATIADHGFLKLEGFVDESKMLKKFLLDIKRDISGIQNIENNVISRKEIITTLEKILITYDLNDVITLHIRSKQITAMGALTPEQNTNWDAAQKVIIAQLGDHFYLKSDTQIKAYEGVAFVRESLWGVSLKIPERITFFNGNHYFLGEEIAENLIFERIDKETIFLRYKDQNLTFNYRPHVQWVIENHD